MKTSPHKEFLTSGIPHATQPAVADPSLCPAWQGFFREARRLAELAKARQGGNAAQPDAATTETASMPEIQPKKV